MEGGKRSFQVKDHIMQLDRNIGILDFTLKYEPLKQDMYRETMEFILSQLIRSLYARR